MTIPIDEGERYRMGTLKIASSDPDKGLSLKVDALKNVFPLKQGDIFSSAKIRKALADYGKNLRAVRFHRLCAHPGNGYQRRSQAH